MTLNGTGQSKKMTQEKKHNLCIILNKYWKKE